MSRAREIADLIGGPTPDIILKTADGAILNLQTSDTTVTDGSVLGAINFTAPNEASGTDAITIGGAIQAVAEGTFSASNNATELVFMTGASEAATSKMVLSSAGNLTIAGGFAASDGSTISTADNTVQLTLISTDADANSGPIMNFYRNSSSPADNDSVGVLEFIGRNDNSQDVTGIQIETKMTDVSDGNEDASFQIGIRRAGAFIDALSFDPTEVVFNDSGANVDFRVESSSLANMFHVDGGEDKIFIGHGATHSYDAYGVEIMMQLEAAGTAPYAGFGMVQNSNDTDSSVLIFGKSRGTALASTTIVQDGDTLGRIEFQGMDGADLETGCSIKGQVDGTPGANDMPGRLVFLTTADDAHSATERMRITAAGDLLVGKTVTTLATQGLRLNGGAGLAVLTRNQGGQLLLNRTGNTGSMAEFYQAGGLSGLIGSGPDGFQINGISSTSGLEFATNAVLPAKNFARIDNAISLGIAAERFDDVFSTNAVTTGSDRTEKQDIAALTSAEMLVAARISQTFHTYRWKDAVADKGDNARIHTGTIAQEVQAAFTAEGLDVSRYAMFMSNTWWGYDVDVAAVEADDTVEPAIEAAEAYTRNAKCYTEDEAPSGSTEKTRLGIRYPELMSFLAAYNEQRFTAIETRLTALEDA